MNINRQRIAIAAIVGTGLVLALLIVFAKPAADQADQADHAAKADKAEPAAASHAAQASHAGAVTLTAAQIGTAGIAVRQAGPAAIHTAITLPGEIRFNADRTAQVVPLLGGTVQAVKADIGQAVKRGQVLALIASPDLSDLRSAALTAQQRLAAARLTFQRERMLWQEKISAQQDVIQARQAMQEAQIAHDNTRQKLRALGVAGAAGDDLNSYALRAPFDGVIVEKHITLGQSVRSDSALFTVSDLAVVWVEAAVPASALDAVRAGEDVTISAAASGATAKGKVAYVGALLGAQTRTASARVVLPNPGAAWRPGMFVDVLVEAVQSSRAVPVAVEASAIQTIDGKPVVFVRTGDGFVARPVTRGRADATRVEVLHGVEAGQAYAAAGSFVIKAELGKASEGGH